MKRIILFATLLLAQGLALAGDWSLPLTTSTYTNFVTEIKNRDVDLALGFDPLYTTPTNISTNTIRWSSAANKWHKWNGTAWVDLATGYAISITGSADSLNAANSYTVTGLTVTGGVLAAAGGVTTAVGSGGKFTLNYTTANTGSRSWRIANDVNVYGDFALQQSTTQTGAVFRDVYSSLNDGTSIWSVAGVEGMRLTGTGLGIGVSSPSTRLSVSSPNPTNGYVATISNSQGTAGRTGTYLLFDATSLADWKIGIAPDVNAFSIYDVIAGLERVRVDAAGNFGLGVTPSAWSLGKTIEIGGPGAFLFGGSSSQLLSGTNAVYSAGWKYVAGTPATYYEQISGSHNWYVAPTGTAGTPITFTLAAHLDSTGLTTTLNTAAAATTQAQNDNSTKVATTAYADRPATETAAGRVELATTAEAVTGTDTARAVTPAGVKAALDAAPQLTRGTEQATISGTAKDFTGIPAWAKRITFLIYDLSTSGNSNLLLQIGPSGGIESTGYTSNAYNSSSGTSSSTAGFVVTAGMEAAGTSIGRVTIENISGNVWVAAGNVRTFSSGLVNSSAGQKSLAGVLTQVRITTVNGTDTFDAGSVNIIYE